VNWKKERMAVRHKLRLLTLAPRFISTSARNALMKRTIQIAAVQLRWVLAEPHLREPE
jgi:hypothetical protein